MVEIRKVYAKDFEEIYELLKFFNNDAISSNEWKQLFTPACQELNNDFFGFALTDNDKCVGYIACIMSKRIINGKSYNLCTTSSWIVLPEYRKGKNSLNLISEVLSLNDFHFQIISPIKASIPYFVKSLGFKENLSSFYTMLPLSLINRLFPASKSIIPQEKIKNFLSESDKNIFDDHQINGIIHFMYKFNNNYIYCVFKPTLYSSYVLNTSPFIRIFTKTWFKIFKKDFFPKKIKLGLLHYTNNPKLFSESIHKYCPYLSKLMNVKGLSLNEKYICKKTAGLIKNNLNYAGIYKSSNLEPQDLDTLYSELTLLNLSHHQL